MAKSTKKAPVAKRETVLVLTDKRVPSESQKAAIRANGTEPTANVQTVNLNITRKGETIIASWLDFGANGDAIERRHTCRVVDGEVIDGTGALNLSKAQTEAFHAALIAGKV